MRKESIQKILATNGYISSFIGGFTASVTLLIIAGRQDLYMILGYLGIIGAAATMVAGKTNLVKYITRNNNIDRIIDVIVIYDVFCYLAMTVSGIYTCVYHKPEYFIYTFVGYGIIACFIAAPRSTYKMLRKDLAFGSIEEFAEWNDKVTTNESMWMLIGASINIILLNVVYKKLNMTKEQMAYVILIISQVIYLLDISISVVEYKIMKSIRQAGAVNESL